MITNSNKYVARLRDRLLNDTILWGAILSIPMVALSLARIPMMGWRPVFAFQIVVVLALWGVWLQRHRVSYYWRLGTIIFLIGSAGLSAYAQHGPAAVAGQLLLLIIVLAVLLTDRKVALGIGLILIAGLLLISWGGISGALPFQIEYQEYARSPVTWALIILAVGGYGGMIAHLVSRLFWDLIEHEQQLAEANAELAIRTEEACAATLAKSQFLATMSHEIRTPMNGILGMAQVLLMPDGNEGDRLDYTRTILSSGQALLTLLNDILDLSKIEAGKVELEAIAMDPGQVVLETRTLFAEIARSKGLGLECGWSGPPRSYLADPHRLRQMLSNLVGNALKFTSQGAIRIEAREVECIDDTALLEFSVSDSGIGISAEKQALLFQRFSQADASVNRSYGGSGLGLSIVAHLAQLMGGEAGVVSQEGQGSRFWFRIRATLVASEDGAEDESLARAGQLSETTASLFSGRVLVVEDGLVNRKVLAAMLGKLGLSVALAEDGQQGVDAIMAGEEAELILMDLQMPVMDGDSAVARIRQWEAEQGLPRRPIVALTAAVFEKDRQRCLAAGMDDFLAKPVTLAALKTVLGRWLPAAASKTVAAVATVAATKPVDDAAIVLLLEEIMPLLEQNKFSAVGRFRVLQEAVAGTEMAAEFAEVGSLLETFKFDQAIAQLRSITSARGWEGIAHV